LALKGENLSRDFGVKHEVRITCAGNGSWRVRGSERPKVRAMNNYTNGLGRKEPAGGVG
jgi:hypothetical protein